MFVYAAGGYYYPGKGLDGLYTDPVRALVRVARDLGIETIP